MERTAPFALIGLFVLLGIAAGAAILVWLTDWDPGRQTDTYAILFQDVSGLSPASEVRFNGLPVGDVTEMALDPAGSGLIRVEIEVLDATPIDGGSVAQLSTQGVTGTAIVSIEGTDPLAPPLPVGPGGVQMVPSVRGTVQSLTADAPALLAATIALLEEVRGFTTPANAARFERILADAETTLDGLSELGRLAELGEILGPVVERLPATLDRADAAIDEAGGALAAIRRLAEEDAPALIARGDAALGRVESVLASGEDRLETTAGLLDSRLEEIGPLIGDLRAGSVAVTDAARSADEVFDVAGPLVAEATASVRDAAAQAAEIASLLRRVAASAEAGVETLTRGTLPGIDRAAASASSAFDAVGRLAHRLSRDPSVLITGR